LILIGGASFWLTAAAGSGFISAYVGCTQARLQTPHSKAAGDATS
jgi:hypothetical protein